MYILFEICMLASLCGLIFTFQNDFLTGAILLKAVASLFFVLTGLCGYIKSRENRRFTKLMLIALVCSMAGDIFLALEKDQNFFFILGVASFAAAHVLFSISFSRACHVCKKDIYACIVLFAGLVVLLCVGNFDFKGLLPVLLGYAVVISFMTVKALSLYRCRQERKRAVLLLMVGGVLFLVSDIVLLFWLFGIDVAKEVQSVNWVLYYLAQGCMAAALNEKNLQFSSKG